MKVPVCIYYKRRRYLASLKAILQTPLRALILSFQTTTVYPLRGKFQTKTWFNKQTNVSMQILGLLSISRQGELCLPGTKEKQYCRLQRPLSTAYECSITLRLLLYANNQQSNERTSSNRSRFTVPSKCRFNAVGRVLT